MSVRGFFDDFSGSIISELQRIQTRTFKTIASRIDRYRVFLTSACSEEDMQTSRQIIADGSYGRTDEKRARDEQLHSETLFTETERSTVEKLADIILPADDVSGSATEAGVPDFIEFMMKDIPSMQVPTRGGTDVAG